MYICLIFAVILQFK